MGNIVTQEAASRIKGDPSQDDLKWLGVDNAAIFHDGYVSDLYENLPGFDGTAVEDPPPKKDEHEVHQDPKTQRLLELFSAAGRGAQLSVAELFDQQGASEELQSTREFNNNIRMRSRLMQRIHLALVREVERVRNKLKSSSKKAAGDALAVAQGSEGQIDPASLLTMASMRVSLSLLKTLRDSNPAIFTNMCESLMALFELCPPQALQKVNANKAQRETLQQIADFACSVAQSSRGTERSYALALLFSLGVSRGSVHDLLQVVRHLSEGAERLPEGGLLAPFWRRLSEHQHEFKLAIPNLFHPDGDELLVKTRSSADTKDERGRLAAMATDGTYLYIWSAEAKLLEKVGTGLHGTVAGTVYERTDRLLADIRALKGEEDGDEHKDGDEPGPPQDPATPGSPRTVMRVVHEAPVFEAPSLEADVVQMLEVGTEFEVLERREADGHSWARVAVGWVARAMDIEILDDDDDDDDEGEEEDDEDEEDEEDEDEEGGSVDASEEASDYSSSASLTRSPGGRQLFVEEVRAGGLLGGAHGSRGGSGAAGSEGGDLCPAWLAFVDGQLFFKAKVSCLQPLEVAVLSAYSLRVDSIMTLALPTLAPTTAAEATEPAPAEVASSPVIPRTPLTGGEGGGEATAATGGEQAADGPAAATTSTPADGDEDEPADNFASFDLGARVLGDPERLSSILTDHEPGTTVDERNLLLPQPQRTPNAQGDTWYMVQGLEDVASSYTVQLDLGRERQLARIGLEYGGGPGALDSRPNLSRLDLLVSTEGTNFEPWSDEAWATGPGISAEPRRPIFSHHIPPENSETVTRAVRYIRVVLHLASGSAALYRLYACGSLGSPAAKKAEPVIPIIVSDGRALLAIHVSRPVIKAMHLPSESSTQQGDQPPAAEGSEEEEEEQKLHVHVLDPLTGEVLRSSAIPTDLDQAALHRQGLASNGDNLLLLRLTNGDLKKPVFSARLLDLKAQEVAEEAELAWENGGHCPFVPQTLAYDLWNNVIWGLDVPHSKAAFWRNVGLPPRIKARRPDHVRDMLVWPVPEYRLEALTEGPWEEELTAKVQAASILTHLDRCAEIYGVPIKAQAGDLVAANEILVSSAGKDEGNTVRFSVRGQNVTTPSALSCRGFSLVVLDSGYCPVDVRSFDTAQGQYYSDLMLDFVSRLPEGAMVLVASREDAATGLTAQGKRALRQLGADQSVEKLEGQDLLVLIGRKGAAPASVLQKVVKRGVGVALVRQKVSLVHVPLSVEPTPQTFSSLIDFILKHSDALLRDDIDRLQQAQVLGALNLLTTNIHQLVTTSTLTSFKDFFQPSELSRLQSLLLKCIDSPPQANQGSRSIADSALKLFVACIDVFYPSATQRCNLLVDYMTQYVQGKLSAFEASVLGLLLKRISNPSALIQLLDEQCKGPSAVGGSASLDLFNSILDISRTEAEAALDTCSSEDAADQPGDEGAGRGGIGRSAVSMLSSLVKQLLSQAVQALGLAAEKAGAAEPGSSKEAAPQAAVDVTVLLHIFSRLSETSTQLLDRAVDAAHTLAVPALPRADASPTKRGGASSIAGLRQPTLTRELDGLLQASPVGALLPLAVFVVMELVRYQSSALISALGPLSKALAPLIERVRRATDLLPADKRPSAARASVEATPRKKVATFESAHPYASNTNETIILSMPRAERITIVFDSQSATERDYDYLIFWKDDTRSERWHPEEKLTGRNGSENWPGCGGRPPLVIEGDSAVIQWMSDGSNEDWGWRFTATAEFKKTVVPEDQHWLVSLDRHLNACGAALAKGLTVSVEWGGELEERNIVWMEDETISSYSSSSSSGPHRPSPLPSPPSSTVTEQPQQPVPTPKDGPAPLSVQTAASRLLSSTPPTGLSPRRGGTTRGDFLDPEVEASFLQSIVTRPGPDSLGAKLVQKMRGRVMEDRGQYESIDNAVYASMAAIIKHNGLAAEAYAVASESREDVPESLLRVWKSGVKMRQFFQIGDVQAAHRRELEGSNHMPSVLERGPSIYSGAEDAVIDKTSKEIVEKAQFLLRIDVPRMAKSSARKRWALMSQFQRAKDGADAASSLAPGGSKDRWAAVVSELHASYKIKSIFEYRRRASEKKKNAKLTVTERLLRFLQWPAKIDEIEAIKDMRSRRAAHRADGIALATTLLTQSASAQDQTYLLSSFMRALRESRHSKDGAVLHVHYLNGVEGCSIESVARLTEAFSLFLRAVVDILRTHAAYASSGTGPPGERRVLDGLLAMALQACSLDYDVKDHELIEDSDLVNVLPHYLSSPVPSLRAAAWKLFEALLPRALSGDDKRCEEEEPTNVSRQLLSLATRQLEAVAQASKAMTNNAGGSISLPDSSAASEEGETPPSPPVVLLQGAMQLSRDMVGPVAAHMPLTLSTTYSMWLFRPKTALDVDGVQPREGSRVQRGPDWMYDNQDGPDGYGLGTVTGVGSQSLTVQWDHNTDRFLYRYGEEVEGRKVWDVLPVEPDSGGTLLYKGATALLDGAKERQSWSAFHVSLNDASNLTFRVAQGEKGWFSVMGRSRVPAESWVHVAVATSPEAVKLYLNGVEDACKPLPTELLEVGPVQKQVVQVESPHPYDPDMEEYYTVEAPGAEGYVVTFSEQTRTERNYDYVQLLSAEDSALTYGDKYSGGYNGSERFFPGLDGVPPLEVNAPRFRVLFKSDRSNQDYGFVLLAAIKLKAGGDEHGKRAAEIRDLNPAPLYLGQAPSYVCPDKSATGLLGNVVVFRSTLDEASIQSLAAASTADLPTAAFEGSRCLDVVSLLDKSIRVMPPTTLRSLATPGVLESVLRLWSAPAFDARLATTRLCEALLPYAEPKLVDVQAGKLSPALPAALSLPVSGKRSAFITSVLLRIGEVLTASVEQACPSSLLVVEGADSLFALTAQRLQLVRSLATTEAWGPIIKDTVVAVLGTTPAVLQGLEDAINTEAAAAQDKQSAASPALAPPPERLLLTAVLGLLGGYLDSLSPGCSALVELADKKGVFEECTVLAPTHCPAIDNSPGADKDRAKKMQQTWQGLGGFGDALVVVLHSEPSRAVLYPRTKLVPQPAKDTAFLSAVLEAAGPELLLSAFKHVLRMDLSSRLPVYLPKTLEEDKVESVESEHPYPANKDRKWKLDFPGAKQMEISFDEQTRTDFGNVWVRFLKTDQGTDFWGEEKYSGRDRQQNWPGLQGRPPLVIPASTCWVSFHSGDDSSDWGFKLSAKAHTVTIVPPPERPPLASHVALVQLYLQGMKALANIIAKLPGFTRSASAITPLLVEAALLKPETTSQYQKKVEPAVWETKHPYDCNEDRYDHITFPGAKRILLAFDPQTTTEKGCDYLRIYKSTERTEYWGENQYSGGKDGSSHNWPGLGSNPPLEIPADQCVLHFHSDGSVVDWGVKVTLTPDFGKGDGLEKMAVSEVMTRTLFLHQYLHDRPMPQPLPLTLDSFEVRPLDALEREPSDSAYDGQALFNPPEAVLSDSLTGPSMDGAKGASSCSGSVVGQTFVVNYRDAEKVCIRAEPRADSISLGLLEPESSVKALEESRDWLRVKHQDVEGWVLRREGDLIYLVPSDATADGVIAIPNDEASDGAGEGGSQRTNPMYECTDAVSAAAETPTLAGLVPADCLRGHSLRLLSALTETARFGALGFARQSVSALISNWPETEPFSLSTFGGPSHFLRFLRISFEQERKDVKNSAKLAVIRHKILQVLRGSERADAHSMAVALMTFSIQQLRDCSELQGVLKPTMAQMRTVETAHNYPDNADEYWPISFPGAKRIKLVFDARCSTEHNCDYVVVYKDGNHSSDNRWSPVNYTGRQNDISGKNWPGVGGRQPLYIDSDHCEIHFHSDGSNNDWGVKIYCYGIMSGPTAEEVEAFRERKEQSAGSLELSCWLLELVAAEPLPAVQEGLYSKGTLRTLRKYLESAEEKDKMWMVHLISSMLGNLSQVKLSPAAGSEVRSLVASLKDMAITQYKAEEANSADRKSSLLQALIQATVLGESSTLFSPDYSTAATARVQDDEDDGGVGETKDEGELLEEKTDSNDDAGATWQAWSKTVAGAVTLSQDDRVASSSSSEPATVVSARAAARGVRTWRLCLESFEAEHPPTVGVVPASWTASSPNSSQAAVGQAPESFGWCDGKLLAPGSTAPVRFGPKLRPGDIVSLTLDSSRGSVSFHRNKALVGTAFGAAGSGAAMDVAAGLLDGGMAYRLAVTLPAGASVRLLAPESEAGEDLLSATSSLLSMSGGGDPSAGFFDKVRDTVDYLRAFSERRLPSVLVKKEFLAPLRERHKVVLESSHPFDAKGFERHVAIPGAAALEVRLDWNTCLGRQDVLEVAAPVDPDQRHRHVLKGLQHGTDAGSFASAIGVGDLVVRGPSWEWGEQDGGAGSLGEVLEVKAWKGKSNAGVLVRWLETEHTALYRWGYESKHDLLYFKPGSQSTRPITIPGDAVRLSLTTVTQQQDEAAASASTGQEAGEGSSWKGALRFNEPQAGVAVGHDPSYELMADFTIEAWVRPAAAGSSHGDSQGGIVSRGVDVEVPEGGLQVHQLYLRVGGDGQQLTFSMTNTDMSPGVSIAGGQVPPEQWTHVAVAVQERSVRLYVNGSEVASGSFQGERLDTLGAGLSIGNFIDRGSTWHGHIHDVRVWSRSLSGSRLMSLSKSASRPLDSSDGLVARFLSSAPPSHHVMPNLANQAGAPGVVSGAHWDESVEELGSSSSSSQPWGYKITVLPIYTLDSLAGIPGVAEDFAAFSEPYLSKGDIRHDMALVRYVNGVVQHKGIGESEVLSVKWDDITPAEADLVRLPLLRELMSSGGGSSGGEGGDKPSSPKGGGAAASTTGGLAKSGARKSPVQCRYTMVQLLNAYLKDVLPLIDLGTIDKPWAMAAYVSRCRGLIYTVLKQPVWNDALNGTASAGSTYDLKLSKSKAAKYYNQVDHEARTTVFSQAFRQIHPLNPRSLRRADKLYTVYWMGERSHDAGGPYRESWSVYCSELQSPALPLLRRTQNGIHAIGQNREQWVLNPGATSQTHMELFFFLGKVMGIVIRNQEFLNLDLSPVVWKLLVHDSLTLEDLEAVDVEFVRSLRTIRNTPEESFEESFSWLDFTTQSSDEQTVELLPGGADVPVTFQNRLEYVRLLEQYRLHEFDKQAAAVRAGMATIVPQRLLALFTWEELESMVCGQKQVDVDLLKAVTEYSGCRADDLHVRFFWQTLENFSNEERSMFLRFCWGRSRLPLRADAFPQRFKLQSFGRTPPDSYLPVSHTCFFSLELPAYSSQEVMQQKLTYAIYNCQAIDGDDTSVGMQAALLGWEE